MQATDTVTDRDFARKAATAARWTGRALWVVLGFTLRVLCVSFAAIAAFVSATSEHESEGENEGSDYFNPNDFNPTHPSHPRATQQTLDDFYGQ